ncbi:MAG: DUF1570 domain-containing protein [Planctomycetes bacterium]|nr:DUF1570 domain-containing protein [Planctomycetota bacterium]
MLRTALSLLALATLVAPSNAQGGYTKEVHADIGITLPRARDYEQIPTQPDEEHVVLYYAEKLPKDKKDARERRPELSVVWIEFVPDPPPKAPEPVAPPEPDEAGRTRAEPKPKPEEAPEKPPVNSLQRFLEQRTYWELGKTEELKPRDGWKASLVALAPRGGLPIKHEGWAYVFEKPGQRTIAFLGECAKGDLGEQSRIWKYIAEHAEFSEPEGADVEKLKLKYIRSDLRGIDYRVKVRAKMVRGWKAEDTENFIVLAHTNDQPLVRNLVADIESIRKEYIRLFPSVKEISAVSTVRVCKDRAEYMAYGGMPGSAGYWNSQTEELVFYDAQVKEKGKRSSGDENTFIVLYHEAFHQYIHYSAGELPPHSWFNEGHGDFFSGADVSGNKVRKIGVNPWRIHTIQRAIAENKFVPWKEIIAFEQPEYYRPDRVHICYAQGWSMIYFLRMSPVVAKHERWSKILDTYFEALQQDYSAQLALLEKQGRSKDEAALRESGVAARKYALERAFQGVDLNELQGEWASYVAKLELKK